MQHIGPNFELILLGIVACAIVYSLLTKAVSRTILTLPIIFTIVGYLVAKPIGMLATPDVLHESKRLVAEITLVLVLFADASHVKLARLRANFKIPLRMLVLGLPLSIGLGTLVVFALGPENGLAMALLTAAVLSPTDAALGQTVMSSSDVPLHLRESINLESGLNDGLALPFVLLGAMGAAAGMFGAEIDGLASTAAIQIILGPLAGLAVGWATAKAMEIACNRDWIAESAQGVVFLSTAFAAFLTAELVGGNGFIAAFCAGVAFGNFYRQDLHFISEFMEGHGQILTMAAFFVFGALLLPDGFAHMSITALIIAVLFLTVVRMLPIWLSLAGTGLANSDKLFLGWFGPRGLASILFTAIILDSFDIPNEEELLACVSMTVFLSIMAHGLTAVPLVKWYGRRSTD